MQFPTPPTKPTPPTPPSMKTSTVVPSTDTHSPAATAPPSVNSSTATTEAPSSEKTTPANNSVPQATNNVPPLASVSTATSTSTEATSETAIPATTSLPKSSSPSTGFSTFFVLIFVIAMGLIAVHWWKNYKPKQGSTVDYTAESSDEIVNLILSPDSFAPTTQVIAKKVLQQTEPSRSTKGNFEVRI